MWSLGAIVYLMACGYPPFFANKDSILVVKTLKSECKFGSPSWKDSSDATQNFIRNTLTANPDDRLSAREARQHLFLNQNSQSDFGSDDTLTAEDAAQPTREFAFLKIPVTKGKITLKDRYLKAVSPFLRCRRCKE